MYDKRKIIGFASVLTVLISAYLYTIAPTVSLWDCGEFIACAHILGVPHPPGTPFFILLCRIFDIIIPFNEVAKRINFLSSLSGALSGGFLYLVIISIFKRFRENRGKKLHLGTHLIAAFSAIGAGLSYSIWDTSVEAEVYSTSILILVICLWLTLHWEENREIRSNDNYLLLLVYLIFLSFGIHLMPLLLIPGTLVFVLITDKKIFVNSKLIIFAAVLILIGITTYYYLMVRAHNSPAINEADPSNLKALWDVISREQYGPMKMFPRKTQIQTHLSTFIALLEQIKIFFKYFSWQYFPYPRESTNNLLKFISTSGTYIYFLTGLWGMFIHYKKERKSFWLFFILYLLLSLGLVFYLNLKFSPSDPNPSHQDREVRERDYFWSPVFFLFMFYVSIGLYWIYEKAKKINNYYVYGSLTLSFLIGFTPFISNIKSHVNRRHNWIAHDYAHNLIISPEEYSIIFTYGDNDTFPVWFLQEVKGFRKFDSQNKKGVQLANFSLMNTSWYIRQLKAAGVPMDFASPFKGTNMERVYQMKKKRGETNLGFEEWVINNIIPLRCEDGQWLRPADILVRNIILCAQGIKPTFKDFIMPNGIFTDSYIKENFSPSINLYFSSPVEPFSGRVFGNHFKMEGFAYRLVGEKGPNMINSKKMFDKITKEFTLSFCEKPWIYTGKAQIKPLFNHSYIYLTFTNQELAKFSRKNKEKLSESDKDTLRILEGILKKAFILSMNARFSTPTTSLVASELKKTYSLLDEEERATNFTDSLFSIINTPSLHLLRAEMLTLKIKNENSIEFKEAKDEFTSLLGNEYFKQPAYMGLIQLYIISNQPEKIKEIIFEISEDPKFLEQILLSAIRGNPEQAIKFLEIWNEIYPSDARRLDPLIQNLRNRNKE